MTTRRKDRRVVVASPDGRRSHDRKRTRRPLVLASSDRALAALGGGLSRLLDLAVERRRAERAAAREETAASRELLAHARRRETRIAYELAVRLGEHRGAIASLRRALVADGGRLLDLLAEAHADYLPALHREVLAYARLVVESEVRDPEAIGLLARSAVNACIASATTAALLRRPMGSDLAALSKVAGAAGRESRLDLLTALDLASRARVQAPAVIDVEGAVRRFEEEQRAREASRDVDVGDEQELEHGDPEGALEGDDAQPEPSAHEAPLSRADAPPLPLARPALEDAPASPPAAPTRPLRGGAGGVLPRFPPRT